MKASHGIKSGSRQKLKRNRKEKFTVEKHMQAFKLGEKVILSTRPSKQAVPPLRFLGARGVIKSKRGAAYVVTIKTGNKKRDLIVRPIHLRRDSWTSSKKK